MNGGVVPDDLLRDAQTWAPSTVELADLELLLSGAYAPLTGFLGPTDLESLRRTGRLADGTAWSVPVTLRVPGRIAAALSGHLILTDHEGAPMAVLDAVDVGSGGR